MNNDNSFKEQETNSADSTKKETEQIRKRLGYISEKRRMIWLIIISSIIVMTIACLQLS